MKNLKMNVEPFFTSQPYVPVPLLNQGPAASSQGPAAGAKSGDENSECSDEKVHEVRTLEGQCFTQISVS